MIVPYIIKKRITGTGEMAKQIRVIIALTEGQVWFPAATWLTIICYSSSRRFNALPTPRAPGIHGMHTCMQAKHSHTKKYEKVVFWFLLKEGVST